MQPASPATLSSPRSERYDSGLTLDIYPHSPLRHGVARSKLGRLPITSCHYLKTNVRRLYFPPLTVRAAR